MEYTELLKKVEDLERWKASLGVSSEIPLDIDQAFRDRFSGLFNINSNGLTGILQANGGAAALTAVSSLTGTKTYYVSDSSGGAVTRKLTFTNGILTSET